MPTTGPVTVLVSSRCGVPRTPEVLMRPDSARTSEPFATHTSSVEREVDSLMSSPLIVALSTVIRPVALMVVFPTNFSAVDHTNPLVHGRGDGSGRVIVDGDPTRHQAGCCR